VQARFNSLDSLVNATEEDLQEVHGVGESISSAVVNFFRDPQNRQEFEKCGLASALLRISPLHSLSISLFQTLSYLLSRRNAIQSAKEQTTNSNPTTRGQKTGNEHSFHRHAE